jgi:hypothetical protein
VSGTVGVLRWSGNEVDESPPARVLVLPGAAYPVEIPGLAFPMRALAPSGWDLWHATWEMTGAPLEHMQQIVGDALAQFVAATCGPPRLILAKPIGTLAAGWAADHDVAAVWTTPLMTNTACVADIRRSRAPALLIAGRNDHAWNEQAVHSTGKTIRVISDADHRWQVGDWQRELDILAQLADATVTFADTLRTDQQDH